MNMSDKTTSDQNQKGKMQYIDLVKYNNVDMQLQGNDVKVGSIPIKNLSYNNGVPRVTWNEEEIHQMNVIEKLQFAVIGKFSYGWPKLDELRVRIPRQCNIKRDCKTALLRSKHILMRFDRSEDYVNIRSKMHTILWLRMG